MSIFTAVSLSTCAVNGQYLCMYLVLFIGLPFHLWADCALFWCPIVQLSVILKTLECHLPQNSIPFNFPASFSMAPPAYISLSVHQWAFFSSSKSTFFIAAISLPLNPWTMCFCPWSSSFSVENAGILYPLRHRALPLSFLEFIWGDQLSSKLNCLSVMKHERR